MKKIYQTKTSARSPVVTALIFTSFSDSLIRTANAKKDWSYLRFLSSPLFSYVTEVMHHALNMEDDRPPVLVLMGESCLGGGGSIKLRLLFLTGDRCS